MALFPNYATPIGFQQLNAFSTVTKFTVPAHATWCLFSVEVNAVRYRSDGTAPTANVGVYLSTSTAIANNPNGQPYMLAGFAVLQAVQFIPVTGTATINVEFYR